jgi:hypothetical protein
MIDWLVFLMTGGFVGIILSLIVSFFKVGPGKPEFNFLKCLALCMVVTLGGPFAAVEIQTRRLKQEIAPVIEHHFINESELEGDVNYFKVLFSSNNTATVYMVCNEQEDWGGTDHPVARLTLKKKKWRSKSGKVFLWAVEQEEILRSQRLNKDNIVWPPYQ